MITYISKIKTTCSFIDPTDAVLHQKLFP